MWTEKTKNGKYKHVERYTDPVTGEGEESFYYYRKEYRSGQKNGTEGTSR